MKVIEGGERNQEQQQAADKAQGRLVGPEERLGEMETEEEEVQPQEKEDSKSVVAKKKIDGEERRSRGGV